VLFIRIAKHRLVMAVLFGLLVLAGGAARGWAVTDQEIAALDYGGPEKPGETAVADPPSLGRLMVQMTLAMGVVLGLIGGVLWAARRFLPRSMPGMRPGQIEILATRTLGQRRSLLLVRARDKTLLLGATPAAIQVLTEFEDEALAWSAAAERAGVEEAAAHAGGTTSLERDRPSLEVFK